MSFSSEKIKVCQKKVDGKYLKDGTEIIYKVDGTIKSIKNYTLDVGTEKDLAIFEFIAKNGRGKFSKEGTFSADKNILTFIPKDWIEKPKKYSMVGMIGVVNFEDHTYKGTMTGCALFDLKAQL